MSQIGTEEDDYEEILETSFINEETTSMESMDSSSTANKYKTPLVATSLSQLSLDAQDKWAQRVIAPYVTLVQRGMAASLGRDASHYNFFLTKKSNLLLKSLKSFISTKRDLPELLYETADVMKSLTDSLGVRLYLVDREHNQLYLYQKYATYPRCRVNYDIDTCESVACYVARTKEYVMVEDVSKDARFKDGISYKDNVKPVLCVPIVTMVSTFAVIELYRDMMKAPYEKNHLKLVVILSGWIGLTIQENQEGFILHMKEIVNNNMLQMVLAFFNDPEPFESLLSAILSYAKKETLAEKGTIYVITDAQKMIADVYAEGISDQHNSVIKKKLSVSLGKQDTVASQVAREKRMINVKDLYADERFRSQVYLDGELMIIERTELCVPVKAKETLLGIISMVNKTENSIFTLEDEKIMHIIACYMGLILSFYRSQKEIKRVKLECESLTDLLQFQLNPGRLDLEHMRLDMDFPMPKNIDEFSYYIVPDQYQLMPHLFIKMLRHVVPKEEINSDELYPFVLAVRNGYRDNPYHNFEHGFITAHAMYTILVRNTEKFSTLEIQALMVAALGHDIDHLAVNNNFLIISNHCFSQMYSTSILENHHCFVMAQILKKFNIFRHDDAERELFTQEVMENIIFTDLLEYFKNRSSLVKILNNNAFRMTHPEHKKLVRSICMTTSDLASQGKPFSVTKRLTDALYREFFAQGDLEKALGFTPLPMMDRDCAQHIPDDQVQFVTIVVLSCADLIRSVLPNTGEIYQNCETLRDTWRRILESRGDKLWRQCDSLVS